MTTLWNYFQRSARKWPAAVALVVDDEKVSYGELNELAAERSIKLEQVAIGTQRSVGLVATRSIETYANYLAIQRMGLATVPIGSHWPTDRVHQVIGAADIPVVLGGEVHSRQPLRSGNTRSAHVGLAASDDNRLGRPTSLAAPSTSEDSIAYVLFTSGSSGAPKGVPIRHRNLSEFIAYNITRYCVGPDSRLSQTFDLTFDPSVFDLFVAWGSGAALHVPTRDELMDPVEFIGRHELTHWYSVPSLIRVARELGTLKAGSLPSLRVSCFAGEKLMRGDADDWSGAATNSTLENLYGPTELTVTVTACCLETNKQDWSRTSNGSIPIGRVYPHLEGRLSRQGEFQVRGPQRFDGYLNPADNVGKFCDDDENDMVSQSNPIPGDAWYRTGDLMAIEENQFVFLGRLDNQVKVAGQRMELEEVEAALEAMDGVDVAVACVLPGPRDTVRLVALFTGSADADEVRRSVEKKLPGFMVPAKVWKTNSVPLNGNGKVDRRACTAIALQHAKQK